MDTYLRLSLFTLRFRGGGVKKGIKNHGINLMLPPIKKMLSISQISRKKQKFYTKIFKIFLRNSSTGLITVVIKPVLE